MNLEARELADSDDNTFKALGLILAAWDEGTESGVASEQMAYAATDPRLPQWPNPKPFFTTISPISIPPNPMRASPAKRLIVCRWAVLIR